MEIEQRSEEEARRIEEVDAAYRRGVEAGKKEYVDMVANLITGKVRKNGMVPDDTKSV